MRSAPSLQSSISNGRFLPERWTKGGELGFVLDVLTGVFESNTVYRALLRTLKTNLSCTVCPKVAVLDVLHSAIRNIWAAVTLSWSWNLFFFCVFNFRLTTLYCNSQRNLRLISSPLFHPFQIYPRTQRMLVGVRVIQYGETVCERVTTAYIAWKSFFTRCWPLYCPLGILPFIHVKTDSEFNLGVLNAIDL